MERLLVWPRRYCRNLDIYVVPFSRFLFVSYSPFPTLVADLYQLSSFDTVTVTKVHKLHYQEVLKHASTDFIMVTIKDQFISRGEMFHYLNSILGKWVFCGERLTSQEVRNAFPVYISIAKTIDTIDIIILHHDENIFHHKSCGIDRVFVQ